MERRGEMTILKCKMCGGDIILSGETHGICDSCGSEVTLPKIDDDSRADMYNRGNYFRRNGNFDAAYSAYEHIISEDKTDAEAHWCLMLCQYGIEYVQNPQNGEYKITCNRMNAESVLENIDYLAALEYSDEYTKDIYRCEAQKIHEIQKRYFEISQNEPPYEVFICFKAEDEFGQRTVGSVEAQNIYYRLSKEGVKTFFSRVTLEDKLGEEYEPYIFSALNSAKIMLVISEKAEYLESRWVKNEWKRYLIMMDRDKSKKIIPVCVNMDPYDLPEEISPVTAPIQAIDLSNLGAMETLVSNILDILNKKRTITSKSEHHDTDVKSLLERVKQCIEEGRQNKAKIYLNRIIAAEPDNAEAYLYLTFWEFGVSNLKDLEGCVSTNSVVESKNFQNALKYGDENLIDKLSNFSDRYNYALGVKYYNEGNYEKAAEILMRASGYKDSGMLAEECNKIIEDRERLVNEENAKKHKERQRKEKKNKLDEMKKTSYLRQRVSDVYPDEYREYVSLYSRMRKYADRHSGCGPLYLGRFFIAALFLFLSGVYIAMNGTYTESYRKLFWDENTLPVIFKYKSILAIAIIIWCISAMHWLAFSGWDSKNPQLSELHYDNSDMWFGGVVGAIAALVLTLACSSSSFGMIGALVCGLVGAATLFISLTLTMYELFCGVFFGRKWRKSARQYLKYQEDIICPICIKLAELEAAAFGSSDEYDVKEILLNYWEKDLELDKSLAGGEKI